MDWNLLGFLPFFVLVTEGLPITRQDAVFSPPSASPEPSSEPFGRPSRLACLTPTSSIELPFFSASIDCPRSSYPLWFQQLDRRFTHPTPSCESRLSSSATFRGQAGQRHSALSIESIAPASTLHAPGHDSLVLTKTVGRSSVLPHLHLHPSCISRIFMI